MRPVGGLICARAERADMAVLEEGCAETIAAKSVTAAAECSRTVAAERGMSAAVAVGEEGACVWRAVVVSDDVASLESRRDVKPRWRAEYPCACCIAVVRARATCPSSVVVTRFLPAREARRRSPPPPARSGPE